MKKIQIDNKTTCVTICRHIFNCPFLLTLKQHHAILGRIMYKWLKWIGDWKWIGTIFKNIYNIHNLEGPLRARRLKFGQNDVSTHEYIIFLKFQPPSSSISKLKIITIHFLPTIHFSALYMIWPYDFRTVLIFKSKS